MRRILFLVLAGIASFSAAFFFLTAGGSSAQETGSPTTDPTQLAPTPEVIAVAMAQETTANNCLDCHSDAERLQAVAEEPEEVVSLNEGSG